MHARELVYAVPGANTFVRIKDMELFAQQFTNGLAVGGIYALIALGYTMVYGVLKLINFAHSDLFTLGAYLGLTLITSWLFSGLGPLWGTALLALMVMGMIALMGALLDRVAYRPLRESPRLSAVVSALGASIFLQNAIMLIYGARNQVYPPNILPRMALSAFGFHIPLARILVLCASLAMMGALYFFLQKTRIGTAIRAAAIDQGAARLMGIDVNRVILMVFMIGPAMGGAAGSAGGSLLWPDQLYDGLGLRVESLHRSHSRRNRQYSGGHGWRASARHNRVAGRSIRFPCLQGRHRLSGADFDTDFTPNGATGRTGG